MAILLAGDMEPVQPVRLRPLGGQGGRWQGETDTCQSPMTDTCQSPPNTHKLPLL